MYKNSKIKSVHLTNFQIFDDRRIQFDKGMNVIVGENNSGKSSIMRAVYWVQTNKPHGDWMCKFGKDGDPLDATVCIEYADGVKISRVRGPKINKYMFFDGNTEHQFEKFGRSGIPQPIQEYLGKTQLPINTDTVPSIAMQDEQPFMVFESGPTKGSLINYLTGVDIADKIKKDLSSEVRSYNKQISNEESRIEDIALELESYENLDKQLRMIEAIENRQKRNAKYSSSIELLRQYAGSRDKRDSIHRDASALETILASFSKLPAQAKLLEAQERCLELARRCLRHKPVLSAIAKLENGLESIKRPQLKLDEDYEHICTLRDIDCDMNTLIEGIVEVTNNIDKVSSELLKYEGQQCPVCKGVIHV